MANNSCYHERNLSQWVHVTGRNSLNEKALLQIYDIKVLTREVGTCSRPLYQGAEIVTTLTPSMIFLSMNYQYAQFRQNYLIENSCIA